MLALLFVSKSALGKVATSETNPSDSKEHVSDTIVVRVECCNPCVREVTEKKPKTKAESCLKYIRVNTCNDTVVPKDFVFNYIEE